jgi:DNA-directed RNA polymerase specialized sigma24 family protein
MAIDDEEFVRFAEAVSPRLRRTAFLLCGDWHTAQDLAQTTLAKVFVAWRRINKRDAVTAYALRTLLNAYLADGRKRRQARYSPRSCPNTLPTCQRPNCGWRCSTPSPRCRHGPGPWSSCGTGPT